MDRNILPTLQKPRAWLATAACLVLLGFPGAGSPQAQTGSTSAERPARADAAHPAQRDSLLPGLVATFSDAKHSVKLVTPTPNFYLEANESLHPSLSLSFDAEWRGFLSILRAGDYSFQSGTAEVDIGGKRAGNGTVKLDAGRHHIRIRYRREPGEAWLRLRWKADHFPLEPIPRSRFSHRASLSPGREDVLVEQGRRLVEEFGCVNCHRTESPSLKGRLGPSLTAVAKRVSSRWLYHWLAQPSAFRSGSVMPRQLDEPQRRDVTTYLVSLGPGGDFEYQRMSKERGPYHGRQLYSTFGCAACHEQPALSLSGMGSKMSVEALQAYLKDPSQSDPGGRMPSMMLSDKEAFNLAALFTRSRNDEFEQPWEKGDAARGRELVQSAGCLSCHALEDRRPLENKLSAPRLEELTPERGCLAAAPRGVPVYQLTERRRAALQAFLRSFRDSPDVSPAPVYDFRRRVEQLRCVTCHEFDQIGPTAPLAEKAPSLADAGAKLRTTWISRVMTNRVRVNRGGELRMPHYDPGYVGGFAAAMAKASGVAPGRAESGPPATDETRTAGVGLLGTDAQKGGMGCIGCHGFGGRPPLGEEGPYLTHAGERLRYDWFERWMRNPARIVSGTSMPNYFSSTDPAEAGHTIQTLWAALSMGPKMPLPEGFQTQDAALNSEDRPIPVRRPIVIRTYMPEATPAAIAVGLPGNVSYCFDAGESRLRYAWLGGFVDMAPTLLEKKDRATRLTHTPKLVGEIFYRSAEFPLRVGAVDRIPRRRFRGYRLIDGHPRFHYQVDGIDVYERIVAAQSNRGLVREFTIARVQQPMWFLVETPEGAEVTSSLGQPVAGKLAIPRGARVRFDVTVVKRGLR